ncbi:MAG: hypothetical protein M0Q51_15150 [Bacteroidales bacterium]|nr:hypothetical protein [Bacteroidales bacterium]
MKTIRNLFLKSGFITLAFLLATTGCKKEDEPAPGLPPQSSFVMDFSDFSNPGDTLGARDLSTYQNWGYSYANVVVWQTILTVGLAVPVASFLESFNHEAVYHPDQNNWTWSYNVTVNFAVYEAELTGYLEADSVVWEMRITKSAEYADFLWYYGKSALNESGGYWILQENPLSANELLRIDWHKYADGTVDISYTNIRPGDPENGGYILYGTATTDFDRFYDLYNKGQDNLTEIEWSSINKNGHVKDPNHFGDDLWHCWDTNLMDVVCP